MFYKIFYPKLAIMIPPGFAAITLGPFIFIRPKYRSDEGLKQHEIVHVAQFYRNPFTFHFKYLFDAKARFQYEVEAYREQLKHYSYDKTDTFVRLLTNKYWLNIFPDDARDALK